MSGEPETPLQTLGLTWTERARHVLTMFVRASASVVLILVVFAVTPFDLLSDVPLPLSLAVGLLALLVVTGLQIRSIVTSPFPALRAVEALAVTGTLFLFLFASAYLVLEQAQPTSFTGDGLTRVDALYFTVTVFATVGFGDIVATSETARVMVTVQMVLDLLVLGLGIRAFVGAVERGRERVSRGAPGGQDGRPAAPPEDGP
ncbi:metal transporter [Cellulomonas chitinilytica]|uniref:Metal transporter n=1 Tax=Cellulomonas chitinilytica TaxID=398759 RepID=A0A919P4X7_9CELL|nr:potassium channel family protein [Cellulomonas chitinilytica]GIG21074.1 metal transporter [Cellulomonas chitinilytica]